jgi:hypothetical protein
MSRLEDMYHEMVTLEVEKSILAESNLREYRVKKVDVPNYDYSNSLQWKEQKSISVKAYKKLKKIEFDIRNK